MKMVMALIEPQKLPEVRQALYDSDVLGMTISSAMGCSKDLEFKESYRGQDVDMYLFKKVRVEVAVADEKVDRVVNAICNAAKMDIDRTHGMVFIYSLCDAVSVTGARGTEAI